MNFYQQQIAAILAKLARTDVAPHHVEGWMRCERGTLDALDARTFAREVKAAVACIDQTSTADSERLAASYGLRAPGVAS